MDDTESLHTIRNHLWGKNVIKATCVDGKECLTLDLTLFNELSQNIIALTNVLLIRNEYVLAYDAILDSIHRLGRFGVSGSFLVTGQPGIGKTLFLLYILVCQLQEQQPVAFQISTNSFALFDEHGVKLHDSTSILSSSKIPPGTWALSDASVGETGPCKAFHSRKINVIYTSSPSSHRWKEWAKQSAARRYIMDIWSQDELRTLLTICNFNAQQGEALFQKYGRNPRLIEILMEPSSEATYLSDVQAAATELAREFSKNFSALENLDFSSSVSSKIFMVRPDLSNSRNPILSIPTQFLITTLGVAVSRQTVTQKHSFFTILSGHPYLHSPAGWLFENYAHICFSAPNCTEFVGYLHDNPNPHTIPTAREMITGSSKLSHVQPPFNFYWRPGESNSKGVDALICSGNVVWALQFTIGEFHCPATEGLDEIYKDMNHKADVDWCLVIVGPDLDAAKTARDHQELTGRWEKMGVYACELPLGRFNQYQVQKFQANLDEATYSDLDVQMT